MPHGFSARYFSTISASDIVFLYFFDDLNNKRLSENSNTKSRAKRGILEPLRGGLSSHYQNMQDKGDRENDSSVKTRCF
jgi:hypothetical protein